MLVLLFITIEIDRVMCSVESNSIIVMTVSDVVKEIKKYIILKFKYMSELSI